jgi:hypothetical protein
MKKKIIQIKNTAALLTAAMLVVTSPSNAQNLGISATGSTPNNSAMLDVDGDSGLSPGNKKGMLIPRISLSSVSDNTTIASPTISLVVYNTNASMTGGNGTGFYYWDGSKWRYMPTPTNGPGSAGQVLTSQGPNTAPQWSTLSVSGGGGPTGCANCISMISPASSSYMTWGQCADYCLSGTWGGYNDWRMPTFEEAITYRTNPSINKSLSSGWVNDEVWTTTPVYYNMTGLSTPTIYGLWLNFAENGFWTLASYSANNAAYCRCVR